MLVLCKSLVALNSSKTVKALREKGRYNFGHLKTSKYIFPYQLFSCKRTLPPLLRIARNKSLLNYGATQNIIYSKTILVLNISHGAHSTLDLL